MTNTSPLDINRWQVIFANVYLCTLPALVIIFLPMLVGGMVEHLGMTAQQAGFVATADMLGYTIGTVVSFFFIHKLNWRTLTLGCIILMAIANGISGTITDYETLLIIRFISGLGGGVLTAVTFAAIGQMRDPDSAYGWWLVFQAAFGFVGFQYFWDISVNGGFIVLTVLLVLGTLLIRLVPEQALQQGNSRQGIDKSMVGKAIAGVAAILLVYIGLMAEYTYLERIGNEAGLSPDEIGTAFSAMSIAGLIGGGLAAKLGAKFGRLIPALLGACGCIASFYLLSADQMDFSLYAAACCLYFGLWSFLLPYLVGACAAVDSSGRTLAMGNAAIGAGLAFGPFIAASLIGENGYGILAGVATAFVAVGFLLILPLLKALGNTAEPTASSQPIN
ncbi:MFS transporter [Aliamphritea ceti]|uniref:MFS transporter n=1 Tax=Aliamphritea ceti TaxID=1524258 RepID=UPI0021C33734|nr:MFS transporter [Aliamphritea ceti]